MERNFRFSQGRLAEAEGESASWQDLYMQHFIDPDEMNALYAESPAWLRDLMEPGQTASTTICTRSEGHEYLLIDWQSADSTRLPAPPVLSPEGERFAAASRDEDGWYADNLLQVWHLTDDGPVMEFQVTGGFGCEPAAVRWVDASSIEFIWVDENRGREIPAKLVRESTGTWRMDPPPEEYGSYYECRR